MNKFQVCQVCGIRNKNKEPVTWSHCSWGCPYVALETNDEISIVNGRLF